MARSRHAPAFLMWIGGVTTLASCVLLLWNTRSIASKNTQILESRTPLFGALQREIGGIKSQMKAHEHKDEERIGSLERAETRHAADVEALMRQKGR